MWIVSRRTEHKETTKEYTVNRKPERNGERWLEYQPHSDGKDGNPLAAPGPAVGGNLEDPDGLGDEELANAVRRALQQDALTTGTTILVEVEHGVVHLDGRVGYLQDAEAAQAVAARVPGVRHVEDDLDVKSMYDET
jgi:hypothetical protein